MLDLLRQPGPAGGRSISVGSRGPMKPGGGLRRQWGGAARQDTFLKANPLASPGGTRCSVDNA
jgi:hypothetical protein